MKSSRKSNDVSVMVRPSVVLLSYWHQLQVWQSVVGLASAGEQ
jgi:hypothetical protein